MTDTDGDALERPTEGAELADMIVRLALDCLDRSDYSGAEAAYRRACTIYSQLDLTRGTADCKRGLGAVYRETGRYAEAEHALQAARIVYQQLDLPRLAASCDQGLGDVYRETGRYAEAEHALQAAGTVFEHLDLLPRVASCGLSLGDVYRETGRYPEAERAFQTARTAFEHLDLPRQVAGCDLSLGGVYWETGRYAEAEHAFQTARTAFEHLDLPRQVADCEHNLGGVYQRTGRYPEAERAYQAARPVFEQHNLPRQVASCDLNLGTVYLVTGDTAVAERCYMAARKAFIGLGLWLNCAGIDFNRALVCRLRALRLTADTPETRSEHRGVLGRGLGLVIPSTLVRDTVRFSLPDGPRRAAWTATVHQGLQLALEMAAVADQAHTIGELIETWTVAGSFAHTTSPADGDTDQPAAAATSLDHQPSDRTAGPESGPDQSAHHGAWAAAGAGVLLAENVALRLTRPPRLLWTPHPDGATRTGPAGRTVLDTYDAAISKLYPPAVTETPTNRPAIPTW